MKRLCLLSFLAACSGGADPVTLEITAPEGLAEITPGGSVDVAWTITGGNAHVSVDAVRVGDTTGVTIFDQDVFEADVTFPWIGVDLDGNDLPPDAYDLVFTLDGVEQDHRASVMLDGFYFTDPAPGDHPAAQGSYDLQVVTVSLRPLDLETNLDDILIDQRSIGGEFVPHGRTISFLGTDTTGTPVPAGDYTVTLLATDPSTGQIFDSVVGGTLSFTP